MGTALHLGGDARQTDSDAAIRRLQADVLDQRDEEPDTVQVRAPGHALVGSVHAAGLLIIVEQERAHAQAGVAYGVIPSRGSP